MSTILVVDDMAMCREPIAEALRRHGYEVACADGGSGALEALRDRKPDLVLLDVTMPDPDGLTVLRIIRRNPDLKDLPVILLTDRAEHDTVIHAVEWGVQGYLLKANFSLDTLLARVEACLRDTNPTIVGAKNQPNEYYAETSKVDRATATTATLTGPTPAAVGGGLAVSELDQESVDTSAKNNSVRSLSELEPLITKAQLSKLVNDGLKLKPLAATVQNVIAVTGSTGCCAADVAKAVTNDQALCIRLLKLANSSAYSRGHHVDSIQTAVQRIGIHEVRQLVMALGVFDHYVESESKRIDIRLFWEHSIACGLIAAALAKECQYKAADECFLWGTLHDVGRLILLDHAPDEYNKVCNVADELELPLEVVERKLLLMDHSGILKQALDHWRFPHTFIAPVVNHHESSQQIDRLGHEQAKPAKIVALANRIAHGLLLGCSGNEMIYPFDKLVASLGVSASAIERIVAAVPDETKDLKFTMLMHSASGTWPNFGNTVRTRLDTSVRPICVSSEPSTDAFKLFLDCVSEHDDTEPPNLGVIYLREVCEATALFDDYESRETEANCGGLPLIVVCDERADKLIESPWQSRPHTILRTPVPIAVFLRAMRESLTGH